ncbi:pyruvate formate lyase activating enzyme [Trueperella bonasi]|uniref:Pyruvate formate-lyase-activating enzyme n=1 Tax=Trueperella bonasi TaxID=312286 RepID=A0ABT9NHH7_9ACTO|nr:pyruvate formate-lyase-activating protein [Trueperella bonasi]MDP9806858.1 pyruvate formate lyase activating enzyme [Trueperella bonasi]
MPDRSLDARRYFAGEGSTGEYRPEPLEYEVPREAGAGLDGIDLAPEMDHSEHIHAVRAGEVGSVHSWELVTAVDGPGTRMTVFLAGCPLRCLYCHNPDTLRLRDGTRVMADALLDRIRRYKTIFKVTNGGVTFSGGEPLMQPAFLARLLRGAKEAGVHTAIDTSGFLGHSLTDEMMDNVDLVLLDVKSGLPGYYERTTGRPLQPTLNFGQRLSAAGKEIWIRFVLVPGLTDDPENIEAVAEIVSHWESVSRVEVLPFHQMARDKWDSLGMEYQLEGVEPPSSEAAEVAREIFRAKGLTTF